MTVNRLQIQSHRAFVLSVAITLAACSSSSPANDAAQIGGASDGSNTGVDAAQLDSPATGGTGGSAEDGGAGQSGGDAAAGGPLPDASRADGRSGSQPDASHLGDRGTDGDAGGGSLLHATAIAMGASNMCVVLLDHTAACWGYNNEGQVGNGTAASIYVPSAVTGLTGASSIAVSGIASCAVMADATLECWGTNYEGELGVGELTGPELCGGPCSMTPVKVPGLDGVLAVSLGGNHTCALLTGGAVDCWGMNENGQLGNGTTDGPATSMGGVACNPTPTQVSGLTGATAISCGDKHCCALRADTTVSCWGANYQGQLGDGTTKASASPVAVAGLSGVTAIATAEGHTCALLAGGTIECWGANFDGQLGNGTTDASLLPTPVPSLSGVKAIDAGSGLQSRTTCALLNDGTVWCWGLGVYGTLGNGGSANAITTATTPVQVTGITNATAISVGANGGSALLADATVACWGNTGQNKQAATPVLISQ